MAVLMNFLRGARCAPFSAFLFLSLTASMPCALSQTDSSKATPPQTNPPQTTVVNVNEVSLNMVVRDKKGKLIPDLKPEDLAVTDGGVPVKISSLHLMTGDSGEHLLTLVFDRLDSAASHNAREIAAKVLKMAPENVSISVMKAEGRLMLYRDFTSDRRGQNDAILQVTDDDRTEGSKGAEVAEKRLLAIAKTGSDDAGVAVSAKERSRDQVLLSSLQESQKVIQELHTQTGLAGLLALARTQQRLPGRKTIIYFAQGFHSDAFTETRLRDIIGAANRAGVSIYPVDATPPTTEADQGMVAMMAMGNVKSAMAQHGPEASPTGALPVSSPTPSPGIATMVGNQLDRFEAADPTANKSPLIGLAESTGGAYVPMGGDIKKPLRRMIEDMTTYYEATYPSPMEGYDGQFRPIAVTPVRAGLKISSRAGYFAVPPDSGKEIRPFEEPLLKVLTASPLPSDVGFQARVLRLGELSTGYENTLVIQVPVSALETRDDPNTNLYSLHVSLVAQIKDKTGEVIERFGEDVPRHGSLGSKNDAQHAFVTMQRHFLAEPGEYMLEAAILDHNNGKAGAQIAKFEIPRKAAGPTLGDLTMVQRIDPVPEEADPSEPMRYGSGKVVPSVVDRVEKGTKELSFFFVVHPNPESKEQPTLEMEVLKSGEPIAKVPLKLRTTSGPAAIPYLASIQSANLPGGDYEVIERLTQDGKATERDLTFHIEGGEPATEASANAAGTAAKDDADAVTATGLQLPESDGSGGHRLVITTLPSDAAPAPTSEQLQKIIEDARKRALDYSKTLPNFLCLETTNRSVDQVGKGSWKHRDSIVELLSYHDNSESRTTLEVDGKRSSLKRADLNSSWPLSVGEFGAMLNLIFQAKSKTAFEWKEAASLGDGTGTVQVLSYRVARENAAISLSVGNESASVGFHGLVYIDSSTGGVRRVTLQADGIPRTFAVKAAAMTVDYDYVSISNRDYLMPVRSSVSLEKAHKKIELNEITFRNYRRFASRAKIKLLQ